MNPPRRRQVRQGQRDWVAKRNKACGGGSSGDIGSCLTKFYRDRLIALNKPAAHSVARHPNQTRHGPRLRATQLINSSAEG